MRLKFVETQKYLHPPTERDCKTWFEDWLKYEFNSQLYNLGTAQTFENEYAVLRLRARSPFTCSFGQSMIFLATKCEQSLQRSITFCLQTWLKKKRHFVRKLILLSLGEGEQCGKAQLLILVTQIKRGDNYSVNFSTKSLENCLDQVMSWPEPNLKLLTPNQVLPCPQLHVPAL